MKINQLKHYLLFFVTILFCSASFESYAANYVRVATIGTSVPALDKTIGYQKMVEQVIAFWDKELEQIVYDKPDLIILPENCDFPRGLTQAERNEFIRVRKDQILNFFSTKAKSIGSYIIFGTRREDKDGRLWNSGVIVDRLGKLLGIYDKNFPTVSEIENGIQVGTEVPVFECDFGRVAIAICFDLNFDEIREKYIALKPDIIAFPSAYHGGLVQSNWAYASRSFFVGAIFGKGTKSEIRNRLGEIVASNTNYFNYIVTDINLDTKLVHLDFNWSKLRQLKKKYGSEVTINDPGNLGAVSVASESKTVNATQMLKEFNIELLDDYLNRSREVRQKYIRR